MFLVQIKNIFVEKNIFSLIFLFLPSVFPLLQDIWFKHGAERIELTKQRKNVHKMWKDVMFIKKGYCEG